MGNQTSSQDSIIKTSLLESKVKDYIAYSANMPKKSRIISKVFAKAIGQSAGRMMAVYDQMIDMAIKGLPQGEIDAAVNRAVNKSSKVKVNLPFMKEGRICGIVALNYSGFFKSEAKLYSALVRDMKEEGYSSIEQLLDNLPHLNESKRQGYTNILSEKKQAIYDFGVMMGFTDDEKRFQEIKEALPSRIALYFDRISKVHRGGKLNISWPLPIKKFSSVMIEGMKYDSVSYAVQEGLGQDYDFKSPRKEEYSSLKLELDKKKDEVIRNKAPLPLRMRLASALPAAAFYLSGVMASAQDYTLKHGNRTYTNDEIFSAALTASTVVKCCSDDKDTDALSKVTTWFSLFTTTLG